jgi:hypothetical protein
MINRVLSIAFEFSPKNPFGNIIERNILAFNLSHIYVPGAKLALRV